MLLVVSDLVLSRDLNLDQDLIPAQSLDRLGKNL